MKPLVGFLRSLTSNDLQGVRYHSHCRKKVVHVHKVKATNNRKSIDDSDGPSSAKRGRPSKVVASKNCILLTRNTAHKPKEKICVFSPCIWEGEDLARDENDTIVKSFQKLGEVPINSDNLLRCDIPTEFLPLETFTCLVYSNSKTSIRTLKELRWDLVRTKVMEGEKLPPTRGTFIPHLKRANYTSWRDKTYRITNPDIPPIDGNGWTVSNNIYVSGRCILPAAPAAVLELVKCSCKGSCDPEKIICSCVRNKLSCTALCKS